MVVCAHFAKGSCRFGPRCLNEHINPGQKTSTNASASKLTLIDATILQSELSPDERPQWVISSFAATKQAANLLDGLDTSPEELRLRYMMAAAANDASLYPEASLAQTANAAVANALSNISQAVQRAQQLQIEASEQTRSKSVQPSAFSAPSTPVASTSAFGTGQTSAFGSAAPSAFSASPSSAFGAKSSSAFGASSTPIGSSAPPSAFGSAPVSAFGTNSPSAFGTSSPSAFAAPSAFGGTTFGQSSFGSSGFGQKTAFGSPSAFATKPAASGGGFAGFASTLPAQSAFATPQKSTFQAAPSTVVASAPSAAFQSVPSAAFQSAPVSAFTSAPSSAFQSAPSTASQSPAFQTTTSASTSAFGNAAPTSTFAGLGAVYASTLQSEWSEEDQKQYAADRFTWGAIPVLPPPMEAR